HSSAFYYFFSRKVALAFAARAYIYFPGGFGTMDEFFEMLTLKQTGKIKPIPIIMIGTEFWQPLTEFIDTKLRDQHHTISPEDVDLYTVTDDFDQVIDIISKTEPRKPA
ncbi:MAG: LOG family protein, partial [Candidatus Saccharimonadales bacterium]